MNRNRIPLSDPSHDENTLTNGIKNQIIFGALICLLSSNVTLAQNQLEVQSTGIVRTVLLKNDLPNFGTVLQYRNNANQYANMSLTGTGLDSEFWIENEMNVYRWYLSNGTERMALLNNAVGAGLTVGSPTLPAYSNIYGYQSTAPGGLTGVVRGEYGGGISDQSGVFGMNQINEGWGTGVRGIGGKKGVEALVNLGTGSTTYYGLFAKATTTDAGTSYSVYAEEGTESGGANALAGMFDGDVTITGTLNNPSDKKLKTNITSAATVLPLINLLNVKSYNYDTDSYPHIHLPQGRRIGLIAQNVQSVFPHLVEKQVLVKEDIAGAESYTPNTDASVARSKIIKLQNAISRLNPNDEAYKNLSNQLSQLTNDYKSLDPGSSQVDHGKSDSNSTTYKEEFLGVNYIELIPILIQGMQELSAQNEALTQELKDLKAKVEAQN